MSYCATFDDDPAAHRTDIALQAALRESAVAARWWLAAVPTSILAAALRLLAEKHPCDAVYAESAAKLEQLAEGHR